MNLTADDLSRNYAAALHAYLAKGDENALHRAYELGRGTIAAGLGAMDLAQAHQNAMAALLAHQPNPDGCTHTCRLAGVFFSESLWSFEMVQRGFSEANRLLHELNGALNNRAHQLAAANKELNKEIAERRRVEQALRENQENLRRLSKQILFAQEEERKRISRELHDEVGQALTAINMNLVLLKKLAKNQKVAYKIDDLQGLLEQTMERVHNFARELRPAMLDDLGLVPALRSYVRNFGKRTGLRVCFRTTSQVEQLGMEEKSVLYRVMQEGLTNVAKHARASRASVLIRRCNGMIRMEVQDDGRAFSVAERLARSGRQRLGLLGIQERVRLVHGEFFIESQSGRGTTIRVKIPLKTSGAKTN